MRKQPESSYFRTKAHRGCILSKTTPQRYGKTGRLSDLTARSRPLHSTTMLCAALETLSTGVSEAFNRENQATVRSGLIRIFTAGFMLHRQAFRHLMARCPVPGPGRKGHVRSLFLCRTIQPAYTKIKSLDPDNIHL